MLLFLILNGIYDIHDCDTPWSLSTNVPNRCPLYIMITVYTVSVLVYQGHFLLGGLPKGDPPRVLFSRFIPHPTKLIKDLFYSLSYRGMIWLTKTHISPIIRQIHANLHEILVFILIYTCTANKAKTCKHIPCIYPLPLI